MLSNRVCYRLALAAMCSVIAAHNALQFWKLANHIRDQIGLGQLRRYSGLLAIGAANLAGQYRASAAIRAALSATLPSPS